MLNVHHVGPSWTCELVFKDINFPRTSNHSCIFSSLPATYTSFFKMIPLRQEAIRLNRVLGLGLHIVDWLVVFGIAALFALLEFKQPFHRMFSLDDRSIQYPFAEHERVPPILLLVRNSFHINRKQDWLFDIDNSTCYPKSDNFYLLIDPRWPRQTLPPPPRLNIRSSHLLHIWWFSH